jgi:hypothetical protein
MRSQCDDDDRFTIESVSCVVMGLREDTLHQTSSPKTLRLEDSLRFTLKS